MSITAPCRNTIDTLPTDEECWAAVLARDAAYDGRVFYAVSTTGIYCRPTCPAKRPRRDNARFYASSAAAEADGYRPCKRCAPASANPATHELKIAEVCRLIEAAETPPPLSELAAAVGLSPFHLHRVFKAALGITPKAYAMANRNARARAALHTNQTVTDALYEAGFNASSRFYSTAPDALGMSPGRFKSGGRGERIRYATGSCPLGVVLTAASARGLCAVLLGDEPQALAADLRALFPRAHICEAADDLDTLLSAVLGHIAEPETPLDLPLDIRGTAFQHRVWDALRRIPPGTTATYSDIAAAIGAPTAARAVATACAANRLAVAIPCHRVVRSDGSLSGYRWGVERKRALLAGEAGSTIEEEAPRKRATAAGGK